MGQLVNAAKTLARGICMDVQRRSIRDRPRDAVSLDQAGPGEDAGGSPAWEAEEAVRRMEAGERGRDAVDFLDWALPQLGETRRRVLELTFEGAELAEICAELGIERDNASARRSRGLKDLARLRETYEAAA
jgi:DNA-directed RNA polymerase specialized sigma24 family protein